MASAEDYGSFDQVRARLDEILEAVNAEGITLDEALALYEEAVKLGLSACDLSEQDAEALLQADQAPQAEATAEPAAEAAGVSTEES